MNILNTNSISDTLGVNFSPAEKEESKEIIIYPEDSPEDPELALESDFEYARKNMKILIDDGMKTLIDVTDLANQSQAAKGYEVAAILLKSLIDSNQQLLDLSKQREEIKKAKRLNSGESPNSSEAKTVNNNLFVGTSEQLQRLLRGENIG